VNRYLADEGFRREIVRAWRQQGGAGECITVQQAGLAGWSDEDLLALAAERDLLIWTHDLRTMVPAAWARVKRGEAMPGLVFVPWTMPIAEAARDLVLLDAAREDELSQRVIYLPLE